MSPQQLTLARRRLWLGISNVGFWVLAAGSGLYCMTTAGKTTFDLRALAMIGLVALALQAVFDFIGGLGLMPEPRPTVSEFLRRWIRGVLGHTLVLASVGLLSYASFQFSGGFCLAILLATAGLSLARQLLLQAIGGVATKAIAHRDETIFAATATDPAFTGGLVGMGRRAKSLLPARWLETLPVAEVAAESSRRRWQMENGWPRRAFVLILGWNLLGAYLGSLVFQWAGRTPAEALLGHCCWMTLWAFGGLLLLPAASRAAVFATDRAAADSGHDPRDWIARFPNLVGEDGHPNPHLQTIFYPIPSAALRLRQLEKAYLGSVPGNLARNNLYYSWATLTLFGRAVHCNLGRPTLWVFPPSA